MVNAFVRNVIKPEINTFVTRQVDKTVPLSRASRDVYH